jgi:predicted transcriptional regulator of viral defense system
MTLENIKTESMRMALASFEDRGGILSTAEALRARIHPATLYALRDEGRLVRLERGLYRLADAEPLSDPDLVTVAKKISKGIVCLISALAFHNLTTQIPHCVHVALPPGTEEPRLEYPPIQSYRFSSRSYSEGFATHFIDTVPVSIYSPEKTLADCFKFRSRVGLDTAIEALKLYRDRHEVDIESILRHAAICRVARIMRPYMEAIF